jgi:hypothetical protein
MLRVLLLAMLAAAIPAAAQSIAPYVQVGIQGNSNMGYSEPNFFIQPGLEYDGKRLTSLTQFNYSPGIEAPGVQGLGYSIGLQSKGYVRVNRFISLGGGMDYVDLKTSAWRQSSLWVVGGALFPVRSSHYNFGRVYLDCYYPVALDQNHNRLLQATIEIGSHRIRPIAEFGLSRFTEPSYCSSVCTTETGRISAVGVKVMLDHLRKSAER